MYHQRNNTMPYGYNNATNVAGATTNNMSNVAGAATNNMANVAGAEANMPNMPQEVSPYQYGCQHPLLQTLQNCEAMCEHTLTCLLYMNDSACRACQIQLLMDCGDICGVAAKFVARNSPCCQVILRACAQICEACACECAKYPDPESQMCAQMCMHCANECKACLR
ncbi:four-helix bundle copper-binding protein [Bacillus carboniphilus]|uniref:Four-helix bundle copper-binding protein n=1 Tax=Bacillus carboniphilus TaxID=86663 RepID=A0ABY9JSW8_9BACI|nr:four-helix bundle copper-binding protein [Bacillus carboniphilus]WLR41358.1 four-helix bundle copper-binding protein [Bacillus carboniphilus]